MIDSNNVAVTFSRSSDASSDYPSMWAAQKIAGTWQSPALLKTSPTCYNEQGRWGDYAGSSVDPDPSINGIWLYNEYVVDTATWATWLARMDF
jgi:hypothetical protein